MWWVPPGPLCRAAAALLEQALSQPAEHPSEPSCIRTETRIEELLVNLSRTGEEDLEGPDTAKRSWGIALCCSGPWLIEEVVVGAVAVSFAARRVLHGVLAALWFGEEDLPTVRAVRRRTH